MLSPGKYHELVPRDPADNVAYRRATLARAKVDEPFRKVLLAACEEDIQFFINVFVVQFNPMHVGREVGPFILWPFQEDAAQAILAHWRDRQDLLIEKSREMGASWLCLIVQAWVCLFHGWKKFLDISHSEQAVDRPDDSDSLFWKLDFVHRYLPEWMAREVRKRKMGFYYPATDSRVTGAATTDRAGVGGRAMVFLDEFSKQRDDFAILGSTADTGPRVFNGTHYGTGTAFHELSKRPDLHKLVMHWTAHPDKNVGLYRWNQETRRAEYLRYDGPSRSIVPDPAGNDHDPAYEFVTDGTPGGGPFPGVRSPWYDRECIRRASRQDCAMHLDIDPAGSAKQFFDPVQMYSLIRAARDPVWEGEVDCDRQGNLLALVEQKGGRLRLWVRPDGFDALPAARYCAGADVSAGTGATNSCFAAIDGDASRKVLEWADPRTEERPFAAVCVALCRWLKDPQGTGAYFVWDSSGQQGVKFGNAMSEIGTGIPWYFNDDDLIKYSTGRTERRPGWYGSNEQRYSALVDYRSAVCSGLLADRSERCLTETLRFEYVKSGEVKHAEEERSNDPTGARKNHGDMVIATAIAWMLAKEMAAGGRKQKPARTGPEPGTMEWLMALQEGRRRQLEEAY